MGRKVGKKRSNHLTAMLNGVHGGWDADRHIMGLSRHQWRNFMHFAEQKLWRQAVERFRTEKK